MERSYKKSLQMIKLLKIKNKRQYNTAKNYFQILNIESLKYITGLKDFRDIIKLANEV